VVQLTLYVADDSEHEISSQTITWKKRWPVLEEGTEEDYGDFDPVHWKLYYNRSDICEGGEEYAAGWKKAYDFVEDILAKHPNVVFIGDTDALIFGFSHINPKWVADKTIHHAHDWWVLLPVKSQQEFLYKYGKLDPAVLYSKMYCAGIRHMAT
jgi:hypothetical protein